jgi:hypothetical protein
LKEGDLELRIVESVDPDPQQDFEDKFLLSKLLKSKYKVKDGY